MARNLLGAGHAGTARLVGELRLPSQVANPAPFAVRPRPFLLRAPQSIINRTFLITTASTDAHALSALLSSRIEVQWIK